jgi:hypothetical protein
MPPVRPAWSLFALFFLVAVQTLAFGFLAWHRVEASPLSKKCCIFAFTLLMTIWVAEDRKKHNFAAPYEFNAFVFLAWPLAVPYYLYKTRGPRGLWKAAGFWLLAAVPAVVSTVIQIFTRIL